MNEQAEFPAVGIAETDAEHAVQLQLLRAIEQALAASDRERALELMTQLEALSDAHFAAEQILMRLHSYPGYWAHEREHGQLLEEFRKLREHVAADQQFELPAEAEAIRRWLQTHMRTADQALASHLKSHPAAPPPSEIP